MDVHIVLQINPFELAISLHTTQYIGQKKEKKQENTFLLIKTNWCRSSYPPSTAELVRFLI